jgi:hypothetical protein
MDNKRAARLTYYEGVRQATLDHIKTTEEGIRKLEGVKPAKIEKLIADLHEQHEKLLRRIDRHIKDEKAREVSGDSFRDSS